MTGSIHAPDIHESEHPLEPVFRWEPIDGATRYELQVSYDCRTPGFGDCPFDGDLEVDVSVDVPEYSEALSVSLEQPVGRRYFWRVRACQDEACRPWAVTKVRYVDVGRLSNDFNGDGYSDIVISAPRANDRAGTAFVYYGPELAEGHRLETPSTHGDRHFGAAAASAGDLDADGYCDAVVGAPNNQNGDGTFGAVFLYRGGRSGLESTPSLIVTHPEFDQESETFGDALASAGDIDSDGFSELIVGAKHYNHDGIEGDGAVYVYRVSADWTGVEIVTTIPDPFPEARSMFGHAVSSAGDIDADGFADIVVGAPYHDHDAEDAGAAFIYRGAPDGGVELLGTLHSGANWDFTELWFGHDVSALGDLDGDAFGDIAVGAPHYDDNRNGVREGRAFVFRGGSWTEQGDPGFVYTIESPSPEDSGHLGHVVSTAGDVNGDGHPALIIGAPIYGTPDNGAVMILDWSDDDPYVRESAFLTNPSMQEDGLFGYEVAGLGDIDGDGYDDIAVGAVEQDGTAARAGSVFIYHGSASGLDSDAGYLELQNPDGESSSWFGKSISSVVF